MAEVKWIKIVTDIFDDEKILLIESLPDADSVIVIWFKLLCLAGKQNNSGVFSMNGVMPYTDEMFATIFRRKQSTVSMALKTFERFGMIEIVNDTVTIPNWGKHQSLDQLEAKKIYMKNYMAEYRQKQLCKTNSKSNSKANVRQADKDIDKDIDKEKDICGASPRTNKFIPPTIDEVKSYCKERNNLVDAEKWLDFYSSKGWMIGKNKMKDWKAAVRNWERDGKQIKPQQKPANAANFTQRQYDKSHFEGLYEDV